ncbi:hypothetical protein Tco_1263420 [Tanacetum coccineum]
MISPLTGVTHLEVDENDTEVYVLMYKIVKVADTKSVLALGDSSLAMQKSRPLWHILTTEAEYVAADKAVVGKFVDSKSKVNYGSTS